MGKHKGDKAVKPPKRFMKTCREKTSEENRSVLVDRTTGVHYLLIQTGVDAPSHPCWTTREM